MPPHQCRRPSCGLVSLLGIISCKHQHQHKAIKSRATTVAPFNALCLLLFPLVLGVSSASGHPDTGAPGSHSMSTCPPSPQVPPLLGSGGLMARSGRRGQGKWEVQRLWSDEGRKIGRMDSGLLSPGEHAGYDEDRGTVRCSELKGSRLTSPARAAWGRSSSKSGLKHSLQNTEPVHT